jgi:LacI family transcriptional regulator
LRYKGYRDALAEGGLPFEESLLVIAEPTEEASEAAAKKIMDIKPMPDGVFVTNDFAAAVCMRTFLEQGVRVPEDIAVVGFNNEVIGRLIKPTLTTVNYPGREMGEAAARSLVNHLKGMGNIGSISTMTIRAELIVRQSSLKK